MKTRRKTILTAFVAVLFACIAGLTCNLAVTKASDAEYIDVTDPQLTVIGTNVSLKGEINLVYYVSAKGFDSAKHPVQLLVWTEYQNEYTADNATYKLSSRYTKTVEYGGESVLCNLFYYGMPAKNMVDQIYVRAYVGLNGEDYYSEPVKYSILEYLHSMLEKPGITDYQRKLYEAMLKYGGRAQDIFDYMRGWRADETFYSIKVVNGRFGDGFSYGIFKEGDRATVKADAAPQGKKFAYWKDKNDLILSYDEEFTFTASSANIYTAVYVDKLTKASQIHLTASVAYDDDISAAELPDIIEIKDDDGTVKATIRITWDESAFIPSKIGEQTLIATPADEESKAALGDEQVTMTVTVLPFIFKVDDTTGNYHITKYCGKLTKVDIPEAYRNAAVDTIDALAFNAATEMQELYIPDSITEIAKGAINACNELQTIRIPFTGENLTASGSDLLFGYIFGAENVDSQNAYLPVNLNKVIISDQVKTIGENAFENCKNIKEVILPSGLETIYPRAFAYTQIEEISLPPSLKECADKIFDGCNLKRVNITDLNAFVKIDYFIAISGSLFKGNADLYVNGELVTEITIPQGVEQLGWVFSGLNIEKVVIPDSVKNLGYNTFANCVKLNEVVFTGESQITEFRGTFSGCSSLQSVTIPKSMTKMSSAFSSCNALENAYYEGTLADWLSIDITDNSVIEYAKHFYYKNGNDYEELIDAVIPDSVTSIGKNAFCGYKGLKSVTLPDGLTAINESAFSGCSELKEINMPSQLRYIGANAFNSTAITTVVLPEYVREILSGAFAGCSSLTNITIPYGVTTMGDRVFSGCSSLTSIIIPDSVTSIGYSAFNYCSSLTSVTIGNGATSIGYSAFNYCSSLASVTIGNSVTSIGESAFNYCSSLTSVTIPDSVTSIGERAFNYCSSLKNVTIGNGETSIGKYAFYGCTSLTSVTIKGMARIREYAFYRCSSLTSVTIGKVTSIGIWSFGGCVALKEITYDGTKEEWSNVTKGNYWKASVGELTIHCTDGDLTEK